MGIFAVRGLSIRFYLTPWISIVGRHFKLYPMCIVKRYTSIDPKMLIKFCCYTHTKTVIYSIRALSKRCWQHHIWWIANIFLVELKDLIVFLKFISEMSFIKFYSETCSWKHYETIMIRILSVVPNIRFFRLLAITKVIVELNGCFDAL